MQLQTCISIRTSRDLIIFFCTFIYRQ